MCGEWGVSGVLIGLVRCVCVFLLSLLLLPFKASKRASKKGMEYLKILIVEPIMTDTRRLEYALETVFEEWDGLRRGSFSFGLHPQDAAVMEPSSRLKTEAERQNYTLEVISTAGLVRGFWVQFYLLLASRPSPLSRSNSVPCVI